MDGNGIPTAGDMPRDSVIVKVLLVVANVVSAVTPDIDLFWMVGICRVPWEYVNMPCGISFD